MKYSELVKVYETLDSTTKRLEKTYLISELLKKTPKQDLPEIILLLQGKVYPEWDERKIGVASKTVIKAISIATGIENKRIQEDWRKTGDLGKTAENLVKQKRQSTLFSAELKVKKVFENLRKLATLEGMGSVDQKVNLISELLTSAKPIEARYIVKNVLDELRLGVGAGSLRDSIAWAFFPKVIGIFFKCTKCKKYMPKTKKCLECKSIIEPNFKNEIENFNEKNTFNAKSIKEVEKINLKKYEFIVSDNEANAREIYNYFINSVQEAYDVSNDFAVVAEAAKENLIQSLKKISLNPGKPIKVMLAIKVNDVEEAFERVGKPAEIEYKLDGFRLQVHKKGKEIILFTRRLENVTKQFPEVVEYVNKYVEGDSFILDSEAVGFSPKTKKYLPFQRVSQRIKRKYDIEAMAKKFPVELNVFDVIYYNNQNMIKAPFNERRKLAEKIINSNERKIVCVKNLVTSDEKKAGDFYNESLNKGNEGVMFKKLDSPYKPGARVGHMVKYKPVMDTLDLVIVAAEWGEGKRSNWLSSFTLACIDENNNFLEIGKVGTGIKEKADLGVSFQQLTEELRPLIISQKGREVKVKPQLVVEVNYEEIQKSPTYSSGYALRFPRVIKLRVERSPEECSTLQTVDDYYKQQRHRN
ncbi:MAG: ATP-dependent DNA ligase [Candidatus Nanoarchaeia archaeon]|nr:ATP-dependent DNA ligase [Candidatus Nanoarchaeia archaeon]